MAAKKTAERNTVLASQGKACQYRYKRLRLYYFASQRDSKCENCKGPVEAGEEAAFIPRGKKGERFLCVPCAARHVRKVV